MITHIALFRFRSEFSAAQIAQAMAVVTFQDKSGLETYRNHPAHKPIADKLDSMEEHSLGIDFES